MTIKRALIITVLSMLCMTNRAMSQAAGQNPAPIYDTLSIQFKLDSVRINMAFKDNAAHWESFKQDFYDRFSGYPASILQLDIYSGASPEGTARHNRMLGEQRGQAIRRLVRDELGTQIGRITVHNEAARWDGLYDAIAASDEPWRDEVLKIIDMPASDNENARDHRETKLRALHGGEVWKVLTEKYLPPLRSGASAIISFQGGGGQTIYMIGGGCDTVVIRDTVILGGGYTPGPQPSSDGADSVPQRPITPAWDIKSNLLMLGILVPNLEVEVPLGRNNRWSLEAEYFVTKIIWNRNAQASQFHNLGLELRFWFGDRTKHQWLDGLHTGLALGAGYYDWEWNESNGYQGEYLNYYLNIGYQKRFDEHWAVDAGIGLGIMASQYRHYRGSSVYPEDRVEQWDKHLIWTNNGTFIWPGPCHANVSLAYMFNAKPFHIRSKEEKQARQAQKIRKKVAKAKAQGRI